MDLLKDTIDINNYTPAPIFTPTPVIHVGSDEEEPPPLRLAALKKRVGTMVEGVIDCLDEVATGATLFRLVSQLCDLLKYPQIKSKTVLMSLQEYQGLLLTKQILWRICFKINGNREHILNDKCIPEWEAGPIPVWVPIHIIDTKYVDAGNKPRALLRISALVMDGPPAGAIIIQSMPVKYVRWFLKEIGLPKFDQVSECEVFNTMFSTYLGKTPEGRTAMLKFHVNSTQKKHNSSLHRGRDNCPHDMPWFCDRCPKGLDACHLATKKESWAIRECANGHEGYFKPNPDGTYGSYCIRCLFINNQKKE
jgi:hypothetical protein